MPLLPQFDTPGRLRDAPPGSNFYKEWDKVLQTMISDGNDGTGNVGEFYNPTREDVNVLALRSLVWMGLPRRIAVARLRDDHPAAYQAADANTLTDRTDQEEYCEWRVERQGGKIKKVTFTTEVPEYWETLFTHEPDIAVQLYRTLTGNATIVADDLRNGTSYNRNNRWNSTDGIVHLRVRLPLDNTLSAAIGIAKGSALAGATGGSHPRDNFEWPETAGQAPTSADPRVVMDGNTVIRKGLSVTLQDPIGLSIAGWDDTGWTKPDGTPVGNYWRIVRGVPGAALRVEYEVPAKEGFLVGDIRIGGRPIEFGGQIAEHLTIQIVASAGTPA